MPDKPALEYELMLLLSPAFSESEAKAYVESIKKERLEPLGGAVTFEDFWGRKRLAYPIRKEDSAWYAVLDFTIDGAKLRELDEELRIDTRILRHLVIKAAKQGLHQTLTDIEAWNSEHLPQEERKKPEEKRANLRAPRKAPEEIAPVADLDGEDKEVDSANIQKKLDELLDI